jgi:hypothetical protein
MKTNQKGEKKMEKKYTIELEAIRQFEVIATSKEDAFKKLVDAKYTFHHGNVQGFDDVTYRWIHETGDFDNAKVVWEEDYS